MKPVRVIKTGSKELSDEIKSGSKELRNANEKELQQQNKECV